MEANTLNTPNTWPSHSSRTSWQTPPPRSSLPATLLVGPKSLIKLRWLKRKLGRFLIVELFREKTTPKAKKTNYYLCGQSHRTLLQVINNFWLSFRPMLRPCRRSVEKCACHKLVKLLFCQWWWPCLFIVGYHLCQNRSTFQRLELMERVGMLPIWEGQFILIHTVGSVEEG